MAHTSLYRKYRPSTFDDVVGQQHIERTLRNAVAEGQVAHAYLFTGPRGTGKTTTARLLAKALLCERGTTGEPDGTCDQCVDIAEGRHPDVFELDAASRTGVDNVREEIIGRVQLAPSRGDYKIYIIDEVHMLSTAAFNALLKTLEEPPSHVVFVMCTTHPHKVPETIHSRCQRFDFRRISVDEIADRLRYIAEAEGFRVDRGAFNLIARHAEGGMRDAITALEQLASFTGGEVTIDDVEGLLGQVDSAQLFEVTGLVARRDIAGCFRWVAELSETGTDLAELVRELTGHVRDLYVIAAVGDATGIVDRTSEEMAQLTAQAAEFAGPDRLTRILDLLGELASEMRWSSDPRLSLEVALTRMARPQGEMTLEALAERVEAIETGAGTHPVSAPVSAPAQRPAPAPATRPESAKEPTPAEKPAAAVVAEPPAHGESSEVDDAGSGDDSPQAADVEVSAVAPSVAGSIDRAAAKRTWQAALIEIKRLKPARYHSFSNVEIDVDADGETLVLEFPSDAAIAVQMAEEPEMRELVRHGLAAVLGTAPPFRYQLGRGAVRPAEPQPMESEEPQRVDVEPDAEDESHAAETEAHAHAAYEEAAGVATPTPDAPAGDVPDLESVLREQLGAHIVAQDPAKNEGED